MDTSTEAATTDKLGRRNGPRRQYTLSEKRAIAEETLQRGASVALLPVKVSTPTVLPTRRVVTAAGSEAPRGGWIEIQFAGGRLLRVHGRVDHATLSYLIRTLSR